MLVNRDIWKGMGVASLTFTTSHYSQRDGEDRSLAKASRVLYFGITTEISDLLLSPSTCREGTRQHVSRILCQNLNSSFIIFLYHLLFM